MNTHQRISSAATSLNQIAAGLKKVLPTITSGSRVLDYGGGRFDTGRLYAATLGIDLFVFDPFNRTIEENESARSGVPDVVTCNNVLNVIEDDAVLSFVLSDLRSFGVPVYITVYEGDKSGKGRRTGSDQYQRNLKTAAYVPMLQNVFDFVERRGSVIACR